MNELTGLLQQAVLMRLIERMKEAGSWCGETHIQKSMYFLKTLLNVPVEYQFVLYKHGPYSFDLHDELVGMNAYGFIKIESQDPYGPSINITERAQDVIRRFPKTLDELSKPIDFVAKTLGGERVTALERIATALYVTYETDASSSVSERAHKLNELKPHITIEEAKDAVQSVNELIKEATKVGLH
jgi:uncharacterized protein YwgA